MNKEQQTTIHPQLGAAETPAQSRVRSLRGTSSHVWSVRKPSATWTHMACFRSKLVTASISVYRKTLLNEDVSGSCNVWTPAGPVGLVSGSVLRLKMH